uniref:Uncharacterized protein n=1 Tax=Leclercia adecarboxylata TaxID=83655 RepID=A0A5B8KQ65_9ENTR|nr:Hypothetical protein [Leclercia adecarboxylata]
MTQRQNPPARPEATQCQTVGRPGIKQGRVETGPVTPGTILLFQINKSLAFGKKLFNAVYLPCSSSPGNLFARAIPVSAWSFKHFLYKHRAQAGSGFK